MMNLLIFNYGCIIIVVVILQEHFATMNLFPVFNIFIYCQWKDFFSLFKDACKCLEFNCISYK